MYLKNVTGPGMSAIAAQQILAGYVDFKICVSVQTVDDIVLSSSWYMTSTATLSRWTLASLQRSFPKIIFKHWLSKVEESSELVL